jgi:hypothetical protein
MPSAGKGDKRPNLDQIQYLTAFRKYEVSQRQHIAQRKFLSPNAGGAFAAAVAKAHTDKETRRQRRRNVDPKEEARWRRVLPSPYLLVFLSPYLLLSDAFPAGIVEPSKYILPAPRWLLPTFHI